MVTDSCGSLCPTAGSSQTPDITLLTQTVTSLQKQFQQICHALSDKLGDEGDVFFLTGTIILLTVNRNLGLSSITTKVPLTNHAQDLLLLAMSNVSL